MILILAACAGKEEAQGPYNWTGEIVWEGWVDDDPELLTAFNETLQCVSCFEEKPQHRHLGGAREPICTGECVLNPSFPYLIVTEGFIFCPGHANEKRGICDMENGQIVVNQDPEFLDWAIRHELVHWITGKGDELHYTPIMQECADSFLFASQPENTADSQ